MNYEAFYSALGGTVIVCAFIAWLLKRILGSVISESVRESVEQGLEQLRSELRIQEIQIESTLSSFSKEVEDVRSAPLSALAKRQFAFDTRRLQAVDDIWASVSLLESSKFIIQTVSHFDGNKMASGAKKNPLQKEILDGIGDNVGYDPNVRKSLRANSAKPHVTSIVWAYYQAYETICFVGVMNWNMMRKGSYSTSIVKHESIEKLISEVLPERLELVERDGHKAYPIYLEEIEGRLLESFKAMLSEDEEDDANIQRAAAIIQKANAAMRESTQTH